MWEGRFIDAFLKAFLDVNHHHCSVNLNDFDEKSFLQILQCTKFIFIHKCLEVCTQRIVTDEQIRRPVKPRNVRKPGQQRESEEHLLICINCHLNTTNSYNMCIKICSENGPPLSAKNTLGFFMITQHCILQE